MSEDMREDPIGVGETPEEESYEDIFGEHTFMDASELAELLTKEEKEAQSRWNDLRALQEEYKDARDFLTDVLQSLAA